MIHRVCHQGEMPLTLTLVAVDQLKARQTATGVAADGVCTGLIAFVSLVVSLRQQTLIQVCEDTV